MGRAARAKKDGPVPNATRVKLDELAYVKLRLVIRDADVIIAECQAKVNAAVAVRDAALKAVTDQYEIGLTAGTTIQWDDATLEFAFVS